MQMVKSKWSNGKLFGVAPGGAHCPYCPVTHGCAVGYYVSPTPWVPVCEVPESFIGDVGATLAVARHVPQPFLGM